MPSRIRTTPHQTRSCPRLADGPLRPKRAAYSRHWFQEPGQVGQRPPSPARRAQWRETPANTSRRPRRDRHDRQRERGRVRCQAGAHGYCRPLSRLGRIQGGGLPISAPRRGAFALRVAVRANLRPSPGTRRAGGLPPSRIRWAAASLAVVKYMSATGAWRLFRDACLYHGENFAFKSRMKICLDVGDFLHIPVSLMRSQRREVFDGTCEHSLLYSRTIGLGLPA